MKTVTGQYLPPLNTALVEKFFNIIRGEYRAKLAVKNEKKMKRILAICQETVYGTKTLPK